LLAPAINRCMDLDDKHENGGVLPSLDRVLACADCMEAFGFIIVRHIEPVHCPALHEVIEIEDIDSEEPDIDTDLSAAAVIRKKCVDVVN
jgi:hypothetical protein